MNNGSWPRTFRDAAHNTFNEVIVACFSAFFAFG
jgi:hypothetical protein